MPCRFEAINKRRRTGQPAKYPQPLRLHIEQCQMIFQDFLRVHKRNAEVWDNDAVLECAESYKEQEPDENDGEDDDEQNEESGAEFSQDILASDSILILTF